VVGAVIPYKNDAEHLIKNGAGATLPVYIIANDLYVFTWCARAQPHARIVSSEN
jgi:hypothetical protein